MEASPKAIKDILTGDRKYIIPAYQRPYKWDVENVEQLILDIKTVWRPRRRNILSVASFVSRKEMTASRLLMGNKD